MQDRIYERQVTQIGLNIEATKLGGEIAIKSH